MKRPPALIFVNSLFNRINENFIQLFCVLMVCGFSIPKSPPKPEVKYDQALYECEKLLEVHYFS